MLILLRLKDYVRYMYMAFSRSEVRLQLDKDVTCSLNMYTLYTRPGYNLAKHKHKEEYLPTSH